MDRFRVRFDDGESEERRVLRHAFATGSIVQFRGGRVSVWGEFVHGANGTPASYEYELRPEEAPVSDGAGSADRASGPNGHAVAQQQTVTVDARDVDAVELLQGAFFADRPVSFRGELVRVRRQFKHQDGQQWMCTFELEAEAA